jgi:hypothetical protein
MHLGISNDLGEILSHERLASGDPHDTWTKHIHIAAEIGRLHIARFVAGAAIVAIAPVADACVGDLERYDDRASRDPRAIIRSDSLNGTLRI